MTWKTLSSKKIYQNRYMTVTEDELLTDHGDKVTFGIVHKNPAILIIPWDGGKLTLVGQYRHVVDLFSWEFPAGHYEHASVEAAARAELEEEAGLLANQLTPLGTFHVAPGHLTQVCHTFLATDLSAGTQALEPSEQGMQVKEVTPTEFEQMVRSGQIKDGLTISAYELFRLSGLGNAL
ncbi:MAG: NUDIX hydrolase, ADP-ribose pyrophosphatase [Microgenomates group bacterium GW2011_GWC1_46_16]|uniref:Nudix hydrolase domain-containing protein n=2 Tax=Candidatus Collieribacteriota TaxID=1752725 RepID=A0A1F5FY29_9BACT|nr:MAG: ADP-ribose pyrophosphatase [Microgenomates group bacterium GW2011_GWF1_46_12]KKU25643.1 MAG: NUDIX hydrolase, ADP-ribose pyrophosphatase [Microgenomates group bacterium GW2011_GWC1_46_16]KKU27613.1 MAG: ADP-ribose pyrophosphatase [Microgenomates group bacterium GW2011_GWF2_46_18]KKU43653.1 MAG: ADP-ribose pyrophosphatase [Microgenomates group bacterium GW2011_GWA1_46_7]KKU44770.1 MAG: ADP-ribose pyrophosphatase [Microgenomates group bacterium GW2011_GWB1_46_7]OGD70993.1 MAG: hypothetic